VSRFVWLFVAEFDEDVSVAAFWVTPTAQHLSAEFRQALQEIRLLQNIVPIFLYGAVMICLPMFGGIIPRRPEIRRVPYGIADIEIASCFFCPSD
jgi:hypothetical protein